MDNPPRNKAAYVHMTALAKEVSFDDELMHVLLTDGRIISVPIVRFPTLQQATSTERNEYEPGGGGVSLHWPARDEDPSVAKPMAGVDW